MWSQGVGCLLAAAAGVGLCAEGGDLVARARALYNQSRWAEAIAAADQARLDRMRADSADLIAARAYLERFREQQADEDLVRARERLSRLDPSRFTPREQTEYLVGLGETLYLEESYGAAAVVFESVLEPGGAAGPADRERVLDWWATALDRDARPRNEFDRQAVYQRIRERMRIELGAAPDSTAAAYWLAAAARGAGDLQGAWDAAQAGWLRAPMAGPRGAALRADLERLVIEALVPERARALGQPPAALQQMWEEFKQRWGAGE